MSLLALKSKYYVFTLNNPTPAEVDQVKTAECTYLVFGRETGESGTPHLQGYIEFKSRTTGRKLKSFPGFGRAHIERRRGTSQEASDYCEKDGDVFKKGTISVSASGKRTDLDEALELVKSGGKRKALWDAHPKVMVRYEKAMCRAIEMLGPQEEKPVYDLDSYEFVAEPVLDWSRSYVFWGESGIGKTCYARSLLPNALFVSHPDDLVKYDVDLYDGIIFDDMSFGHIPRTGQIHLVDQSDDRSIHCRYQCAFIPAGTKKIFTTNETNGNIFDLTDAAIDRRIAVFHLYK